MKKPNIHLFREIVRTLTWSVFGLIAVLFFTKAWHHSRKDKASLAKQAPKPVHSVSHTH